MAQASSAPVSYDYDVVRKFAVMTVVWGIFQWRWAFSSRPNWYGQNFLASEFTHFGRLRPTHTNAVIFAFGGCALFATSYYVVQRTCRYNPGLPRAGKIHLLGLARSSVSAAITLPLGLTSSKEYAELEWPIDLLIAVVWISYAIVFLGTIRNRTTPHIYVANWFYAAFIIVIAVLHIVNSMAYPVSAFKSYSLTRVQSMPWFSGGMATTPWASS